MSDYKLPDLPSDDELGITEEDLRALEESEGGPEPGRKPAGPPPAGDAGGPPGGEDPDDERVFRWGGPLMLLLIVGLGWTASIRTGLPEPVPAEAPDTTFSAVRAGTMLEEIVRAPRPTGSPEHARVRAYLVDRLGSLGLEPEVQTTTAVLQGDGFARAATVRNVIARVPGADPTGAILLTAHYDGTELSPGAGDNASGLVTVLEALRAVLAGTPLRNDIVVLFSDAEEIGLLGADAFARDHPSMQNVEVVVSFEMRGSGGPSILFETADGNGAVVRALDAANPRVFGTSLGEEFFRYMPHGTDFTVFERAGKPGLNFAAIDNASVYHTPRDLPSALSSHTLQHHGDHALGALRGLGSLDLSEIRAPDVVYFTVPGLGLVVYPVGWVLPLSGLLVLSAVGAFFVARRRGARTAGIVAGFGVAIVAIALGYGAGYLMVDQASGAHLEAGRLPGALFYGEGWYVLALAAATLFVVLLLLRLARRRLSLIELTLGAVIVPLAAAIGLSVAAPLAAMQLQWPTLAALVVSTLLALLGTRSESWLGWIVALLLTVPVLFLLVPAVELLWLAATL
ncbi:MAG: M28 family peptidase, partial [Gemmatimonadota bacterium]